MKISVTWMLCLLLAACSHAEIWRYDCNSGGKAQVTYDGEQAVLQYQGASHHLQRAISASGARYRDEALEWWTKGSEATLFADDQGQAGEMLDQCHAVR